MRTGSFQLLMFTVENYHTFCSALTAGTLQIAYGYPLVIIWLLAHVFIILLPFPLLNINFSIELNKWFLNCHGSYLVFLGHSEDIWLIIWWSPLIRVQELLVPCLCANYSVWHISLWDHIISDNYSVVLCRLNKKTRKIIWPFMNINKCTRKYLMFFYCFR